MQDFYTYSFVYSLFIWIIHLFTTFLSLDSFLYFISSIWNNFLSALKTSFRIYFTEGLLITTMFSLPKMSLFFPHFFSLFFYWRVIALQNFVVFCQTSTWVSDRYTYIPSLLNLPPISLPIPPLEVDTEHISFSGVIQQIPVGYLFNIW